MAQLVARVLWEHEVEGSSPFTPTNGIYIYFIVFYERRVRLGQFKSGHSPDKTTALPLG